MGRIGPMMGKLGLLWLLGLNVWTGSAATITATNASVVAVQAAINLANRAGGDTVSIPAGTNYAVTNIWVNFPVTIIGAGTNATVFIDEVPRSLSVPSVWRTGFEANSLFSLGGFSIWGGTTNTADGSDFGEIHWSGNSHMLRIHDVAIVTNKSTGITIRNGFGVIDHNVLRSYPYGRQGIKVFCAGYAGKSYGDGSWADDDLLGTASALYIENNTFADDNFGAVCDWYEGARIVFRYNTVTNSFIGNHGTDSTQRYRSARTWEIYGNTFSWNNGVVPNSPWPFAVYLRGGTGVIFSNTFQAFDSDTYTHPILAANYRNTQNSEGYPWPPWGPAENAKPGVDGPNLWDQNTDTNGYACLDQVGRGKGDLISGDTPVNSVFGSRQWPRQALSPVYQWANKRNGVAVTMASQTLNIQANRDWYDEVAKPGYSTYAYPHPLVSGVSLPAPATNLHITTSGGGSVRLSWDASTDPAVNDYHLYWGGASGTYTNSVDTSSATTALVTGLASDSYYYFAATATTTNAVESTFSNEAVFTPPPVIQVLRTGRSSALLQGLDLTQW